MEQQRKLYKNQWPFAYFPDALSRTDEPYVDLRLSISVDKLLIVINESLTEVQCVSYLDLF